MDDYCLKGKKEIRYICLRGEPIIYIKGIPYCVRDSKYELNEINYYENISSNNLEKMEERLKEDILNELNLNSNKIKVDLENLNDNSILSFFEEKVEKEDVQTFSEIIQKLKENKKNINFSFQRIPIPPTTNNEQLYYQNIYQIYQNSNNCFVIFSCSSGIGRSNIAIIISILIRKSQKIKFHSFDISTDFQKIELSKAWRGQFHLVKSLLR